ncbi:MAG: dienelactone hydrolase family protein [Proteobacteria bacterium]|nr:dienelactone hydrolase family protein [Pseudomonadota bacterium]HQR03365.1 dienelactone hydrolase family protein [Rhodocyclaceae bacterium]
MKRSTLLATLLALATLSATTLATAADTAHLAPAGTKLPPFMKLPPPTQMTETTAGDIVFETRTPYDFDVLLSRYQTLPRQSGMGTLVLPAGASAKHPVPAVVLVHGSGGLTPGRESQYAALLAANGFAALYIDYYRPRGITESTPYVVKTLGVTEFDAVSDAYSALRALNADPAIDHKRIAIMGFSYGGMATRIALDERVRDAIAPDLPPFAAHVDFYGPCFQDFHVKKTTGAPVLSLRGGEDASNDLAACAQREIELRGAGSEVSSVIYARAGHAWEAGKPRALNNYPYLAGCTISYDDAGFPSVGGKAVIPVGADPSREQRFHLRMNMGDVMGACVKIGYIVGRDDATRVQSDYQMLQFLRRVLN